MNSEDSGRADAAGTGAGFRPSILSVLIGVVLALATAATVRGLYLLTGSYLIALPVGLAAQGALLLAGLGAGHGIARLAGRGADGTPAGGTARWLRRIGLAAAVPLAFGACWFVAFAAYHEVFLARGGDVDTTATHAARLADAAMLPLRREVDRRPQATAAELRERGPVADHLQRLREMAAGRPPEAAVLAEARRRYAEERQRVRAELARQRTSLLARQAAVETQVRTTEQALAAERQELAALPQRLIDLRRAFAEEQTGVLPPPGAPAPHADPAPAATPPPALSIVLRPDGLAATLVREPTCRLPRQPGAGPCHRALEIALQAAGPRERELIRLIAEQEDSLSGLGDEAQSLPGVLAGIDRQLVLNPALPERAGEEPGPFAYLTEARERFDRALTEGAFIALVDECRPVVTALRALAEGERPAMLREFDCRPDPVVAAVEERQRLEAAARDFANLCGSGPTGQRVAAIVARLRADLPPDGAMPAGLTRVERRARALDAVRPTVIDPCLAAAGLAGVAPEPFTRLAAAYEAAVTPRQAALPLATGSVMELASLQGTPPAVLAAVCALGQTLALLGLAMLRGADVGAARRTPARATRAKPSYHVAWAPRDGDPPEVAGAKLLLRARSDRADGSSIAAGFAADAAPDIKASAQQLLGRLIREGHAQAASFGQRIFLAPEALEEAERIVEDHAALPIVGAPRPPAARPADDALKTPVPG